VLIQLPSALQPARSFASALATWNSKPSLRFLFSTATSSRGPKLSPRGKIWDGAIKSSSTPRVSPECSANRHCLLAWRSPCGGACRGQSNGQRAEPNARRRRAAAWHAFRRCSLEKLTTTFSPGLAPPSSTRTGSSPGTHTCSAPDARHVRQRDVHERGNWASGA
jgi:hypothetical protein